MQDTHLRSFVKGITWRLLGTLSTILISFLITKNMIIAGTIGGFEMITKILLFYFHERLWGIIHFGKKNELFDRMVSKGILTPPSYDLQPISTLSSVNSKTNL